MRYQEATFHSSGSGIVTLPEGSIVAGHTVGRSGTVYYRVLIPIVEQPPPEKIECPKCRGRYWTCMLRHYPHREGCPHCPDCPPEIMCPDGGRCHHACTPSSCFRVQCCGPLSGVYPNDEWPADVVAENVKCRTCGGRGWIVEDQTWGQPEGEQHQCPDCAESEALT